MILVLPSSGSGGRRRRRRSRHAILPVVEVEVIEWPGDEELLAQSRRESIPRLVVVGPSADFEPLDDPLEDWIRQPARSADIARRIEALSSRVRARRHDAQPWLDAAGLVNGRGSLPLSDIDHRLMVELVTRFGEVVPRADLLAAGWPGEATSANTLAVHLARLRTPLAGLGLRLRARRSRGYLLEVAPEERRRSPSREPP